MTFLEAEGRRSWAAESLGGPDSLTRWIKLDLLTQRIVGRRLEQGASPETDEVLDKAPVLRAWWVRRPVN